MRVCMHDDAVVVVVSERCDSLAASESPEAIDVVGAAGRGVFTASSRALVALLHVFEHLTATSVAELVGGPAEVAREEGAEGGDGESTSRGTHDFSRVRRGEQELSVHLETLGVRVVELSNGHAVDTLEGMARNHSAVRVI